MQYDKFMEPINAFNRLIRGLPLKGREMMKDHVFQIKFIHILRNMLQSLINHKKHDDVPSYIETLISFQNKSTPNIELIYNELMMDYEWIHSILKSKSGSALDIANITALFSHSKSVTFKVINEYILDEHEWNSVVNDLMASYEMGLFTEIRFHLTTDQYGQQDMHEMAVGHLEMLDSKWNCHRKGNMITFNIKEESKTAEQTKRFCERAEQMIVSLTAEVSRIEGRLEFERIEIRLAVQKQRILEQRLDTFAQHLNIPAGDSEVQQENQRLKKQISEIQQKMVGMQREYEETLSQKDSVIKELTRSISHQREATS